MRERGRRKDEGETLREVRHNMSKTFIKLHFINTYKRNYDFILNLTPVCKKDSQQPLLEELISSYEPLRCHEQLQLVNSRDGMCIS